MVTYYVMERTTICSPIIGQCFDTMIVVSSDKEWLQWPIELLVLETVLSHLNFRFKEVSNWVLVSSSPELLLTVKVFLERLWCSRFYKFDSYCSGQTLCFFSLTYVCFVPANWLIRGLSDKSSNMRLKSRKHQNDGGYLALCHVRIPNCEICLWTTRRRVRILQWLLNIGMFCPCHGTHQRAFSELVKDRVWSPAGIKMIVAIWPYVI